MSEREEAERQCAEREAKQREKQIQDACRLIAKSRYDAVNASGQRLMMEAQMLADTLYGIRAALEHEGDFDLTISVIDARLASWWKCKNRETQLIKPESEPRHVKD